MRKITKDEVAKMARENSVQLSLLQKTMANVEYWRRLSHVLFVLYARRKEKIEDDLPFDVSETVKCGERKGSLRIFLFEQNYLYVKNELCDKKRLEEIECANKTYRITW